MAELRFEKRMSDQDALMWAIEKDPLLRSTITSISILDQAPDRKIFESKLERASQTVPRLHQRVASAPFNIAPPEWVDDEHVDLGYHVRWQKAPGDGTLRDVLDYAAPFAMAGFDRARPLWEFVVLEGLEGGQAALVTKLHHALTDGVGAMKLTMSYLDTKRVPTKEEPPLPEAVREPRPSAQQLLRDGLEHQARRTAGLASRLPGQVFGLLQDPVGNARSIVAGAQSAARMLQPASAPMSPIMGGRSLSVRFDTLAASLPKMKAAAKLADGRLNDAFVAAVAGGLDRYHRLHGAPVEQLRMTMPINVRVDDGTVTAGNQFVPARFPFPVSIVDPVERMRVLGARVRAERAEPALGFVTPVAGVLNRLPVSLTTAVFGSMLKAIDVVTSNVPGAPIPVYTAGAQVLCNYGFGPLGGAASNITLLSYIDELHLAISTDPAAVPDPEVFVQCLAEGLEEVQALG